MAKRLSDSEKWSDPWFRKLPAYIKLFWLFILDNCDHAGIYQPDFDHFFYLSKVKPENIVTDDLIHDEAAIEQAIMEFLNERIQKLENGKWFIPKFLDFQYGTLNEKIAVQRSAINKLKKERVWEGYNKGLLNPLDTLSQPLTNPSPRVKDKDKDKKGQPLANPSGAMEVVKRFNQLTGGRARKPSKELNDRLKNGDLDITQAIEILEKMWGHWQGTDNEQHFNLVTLFRPSKWEKNLSMAWNTKKGPKLKRIDSRKKLIECDRIDPETETDQKRENAINAIKEDEVLYNSFLEYLKNNSLMDFFKANGLNYSSRIRKSAVFFLESEWEKMNNG